MSNYGRRKRSLVLLNLISDDDEDDLEDGGARLSPHHVQKRLNGPSDTQRHANEREEKEQRLEPGSQTNTVLSQSPMARPSPVNWKLKEPWRRVRKRYTARSNPRDLSNRVVLGEKTTNLKTRPGASIGAQKTDPSPVSRTLLPTVPPWNLETKIVRSPPIQIVTPQRKKHRQNPIGCPMQQHEIKTYRKGADVHQKDIAGAPSGPERNKDLFTKRRGAAPQQRLANVNADIVWHSKHRLESSPDIARDPAETASLNAPTSQRKASLANSTDVSSHDLYELPVTSNDGLHSMPKAGTSRHTLRGHSNSSSQRRATPGKDTRTQPLSRKSFGFRPDPSCSSLTFSNPSIFGLSSPRLCPEGLSGEVTQTGRHMSGDDQRIQAYPGNISGSASYGENPSIQHDSIRSSQGFLQTTRLMSEPLSSEKTGESSDDGSSQIVKNWSARKEDLEDGTAGSSSAMNEETEEFVAREIPSSDRSRVGLLMTDTEQWKQRELNEVVMRDLDFREPLEMPSEDEDLGSEDIDCGMDSTDPLHTDAEEYDLAQELR